MTISKPVEAPIEPKMSSLWGALREAVLGLEVGEVIEVSDGPKNTSSMVLEMAKRNGRRVTTRKTKKGTIKIWRVN